MPDLRQVFNDLIRFEIELWNAVDTRLKRGFDLPMTHFEPMYAEAGQAFDDELQRRLGAAVPERTLRQFAATLARLRAAGYRAEMEDIA